MTPERTRQPDRMHVERAGHVQQREPLHAVRMEILDGELQPGRPIVGPWFRDPARGRDDLQAQALDTERRRGV